MAIENWKISVETIGREKQPVVVIDDFHPDPDALISDAASREFAAIAPHYPGVRAPVPRAYLEHLALLHDTDVLANFNFAPPYGFQECYYSMVTTPPDRLSPIQSIPHFDGAGDYKIAILHHLSREDFGGTAFYRHNETGIETVTSETLPRYRESINAQAAQAGGLKPQYFREDDSKFTRIATLEHKFNRAVFYRGVNLHAIDLRPDFNFDDDPSTGRLTVNTFIYGSGPA